MTKQKLIPQWTPTQGQREHVEKRAEEMGLTITGYIKHLVNTDMKKKGGKR